MYTLFRGQRKLPVDQALSLRGGELHLFDPAQGYPAPMRLLGGYPGEPAAGRPMGGEPSAAGRPAELPSGPSNATSSPASPVISRTRSGQPGCE